ncbi:alcohol dehydrogenase catalytic domain-containing protein [Dactylosporangium sp. NPDC049525]|uniref:zinc-dependent alcohol dehydrogenase n=1 Tax=Dactylosporangium sp. NPDC049525 TaxID=3154730 RepID=UPI00342AB6B0
MTDDGFVMRLHGIGDLRGGAEPRPVPADGMSLVRVTAVGICGSDLHWFTHGGIGDAQLRRPVVPGHEFAGVVHGGPLHGHRVAVDPAIPCGRCARCREGFGNLCPAVRFSGHGELDGALREWMVWPTELLHPLPDGLTDTDGAMLEPLGVALHAFDLGHLRLGGSVAVVGCGPIGLLLVQLARFAGAARVVAMDPLAHRAEAARGFGADEAVPSGAPAALDGADADVVFEVAGNDEAVHAAVSAARPGGRVVLVGIPDEDRTTFPAGTARRKGLTFAMCRRMNHAYPRAIDLVRRGRVDVTSLVTHRFPLTEAAEAFRTAVGRAGLKVVITP